MYQMYVCMWVCVYVCMCMYVCMYDPCYFPEYPHLAPPPHPSPSLHWDHNRKRSVLLLLTFAVSCLLVSLRVQIFIVLRLWSYDDSNTENIYEDTTVMHFRLLLHRSWSREASHPREARNQKKIVLWIFITPYLIWIPFKQPLSSK